MLRASYPKDKSKLIVRVIQKLDIKFRQLKDKRVRCKNYIIYYEDKEYRVEDVKVNRVVFKTKAIDRLRDFLWKRLVLIEI